MQKFIILLLLLSIPPLLCAQAPDKEDKRLERAEKRSIRDSIAAAKDSLFWANVYKQDSVRREYRRKEGTIEIRATSSSTDKEVFDLLARTLIEEGYIIIADKEYGTLRTEPQNAGMGAFSLYYRISPSENGCIVRGYALSHSTVGINMYGIVSVDSAPDKIVNIGTQKSLNRQAFSIYEKHLASLPGSTLEYIKKK